MTLLSILPPNQMSPFFSLSVNAAITSSFWALASELVNGDCICGTGSDKFVLGVSVVVICDVMVRAERKVAFLFFVNASGSPLLISV